MNIKIKSAVFFISFFYHQLFLVEGLNLLTIVHGAKSNQKHNMKESYICRYLYYMVYTLQNNGLCRMQL